MAASLVISALIIMGVWMFGEGMKEIAAIFRDIRENENRRHR